MKNFKLFFLAFFLLVTNVSFAGSQDKINVFLEEFIDGKPTGQFIHFYLIVYSTTEKEKTKWLLTEETFSEIKDQGFVTVSLHQSRSNDDYDTPVLTGVRWVSGKEVQCTYGPFGGGMDVKLKATKGNAGVYDWNIYCSGTYKLTGNDSLHKWEFKSVREELLPFKKIRFQSLYYGKDL